jgi:4-amino-4-deoxy-L-arabinose transferase-like glycosyltransferase
MKLPFVILLFGVIFLGAILRFYNISNNPPGLYLDEVSIGLNAYDILKTGKDQFGISYPLAFKSFGDYKMPIYIYLVSLSMLIFGKTEFAVRFPSALAGTLTVLVIFFLLKELLENDKKTKQIANVLALIGSAVLAILPWHLQFSRGGFENSVALLFYSTGWLLGIRYWKTKKWLYLLGIALCFCFAEYTYQLYRIVSPLTFFIVAVILFFKEKKLFKNVLLAFIIFIILSLPLILFSFTLHGQERFFETSAFGQNLFSKGIIGIFRDGIIFVNNYLSYFSLTYFFHLGDQINRHQVQNFGLLYLWQLPFLVAGLYFLAKTKNALIRFVTIFFLLVGPIAPALVLPSPHTLRFLSGTIPSTLLTTLGIYQIYVARIKWRKFVFVVVSAIVAVSFIYFLDYYFVQYPKESQIDWGGACKQVAYEIQKDSTTYSHIVVDKNLGCIPEYFSFYIPSIPLSYVGTSWIKPKTWENQKVLYVRPFYGNSEPANLEKNIRLTNVDRDIFAQLYSL